MHLSKILPTSCSDERASQERRAVDVTGKFPWAHRGHATEALRPSIMLGNSRWSSSRWGAQSRLRCDKRGRGPGGTNHGTPSSLPRLPVLALKGGPVLGCSDELEATGTGHAL